MALNPQAVGAKGPPVRVSWTSKDTILYALGVGCGVEQLEFTTENTAGVRQRVLPTYATIVGARGLLPPGVGEFDAARMVHGSQAIELIRELPAQGEVEIRPVVTGIWDKGSAGVVDVEVECRDVASGEAIARTRHSLFCRGAGGFGGDRGPSTRLDFPERDADWSITCQTGPNQALLYRLSGDRNPLHSDPAYARRGGFERPILHGLCTYGLTGRALVEGPCRGDPARLASMSARFSQPVYPGDALTVRLWDLGGGRVVFWTCNAEGAIVIDQGEADIRP